MGRGLHVHVDTHCAITDNDTELHAVHNNAFSQTEQYK